MTVFTGEITVPVNVELSIKMPDGTTKPFTEENLKTFRLVREQAFVENRLALFEKWMGIDTTDYGNERCPEGFEKIWEAVNLALYLVEAFTVYDFANLEHPEYRENAERLARLMGALPPDEDVVFWDGKKRQCDECTNRRLWTHRSGQSVAFCRYHPLGQTHEVAPVDDVPF